MELNNPNIQLYFFILNEFPLTIGYDDDIVKEKIELLKNTYSIGLKEKQFREYLNCVYKIDSKQTKISKKGTPLNDINREKYSSSGVPKIKKEKRKRVYCPIEYHSVDSICKEYKLNDLDKKYIQNEIDKRVRNADLKAKNLIEQLKIFN